MALHHLSRRILSRRIKVSLVVSDLAGGGVVRAYLLGQILKKLEIDVEILGFLFGAELYAIPPKGMKVVSLPGQPYPAFFKSVSRLLQKIDGDVIYAVKPKPTSFGGSLLKKLSTCRPIILDIDDWEMSWYGGDQWTYRPTLKQLTRDLFKPNGQLRTPDHPLYVRWLERWVSLADAMTVDTQFLLERFGGIYLPNGKDTNLFSPDLYEGDHSRLKYGLVGYRVLMFPGAPRPHKGVEDLLMALDQLNQSDLRLVIVGGSPYDDYDDYLIKHWGRWIIKLPRQPVESMPEILSAAHLVVVPQRDTLTAKAQFPLKLTDGMAMAKPILSTRVGDIPSILEGCGYLVEPNCPTQIAAAIQIIFSDLEAANQMGGKARDKCVQLYSLEAMSKTLADLINQLRLN